MGTFRELQDRIALDYLNRFDLLPATQRAIKNAIRSYEARRYWFNEASTATVCTANNATLGVPSDFMAPVRLELTVNGMAYTLEEAPFSTVRKMNATGVANQPTHFAYFGDAFVLAALPASAYPATIYYTRTLPELSADSDTNAWTTEAANLIAHAATIDLCLNTLKNVAPQVVAGHVRSLALAENELNARNSLRFTSRLKPTRF